MKERKRRKNTTHNRIFISRVNTGGCVIFLGAATAGTINYLAVFCIFF